MWKMNFVGMSSGQMLDMVNLGLGTLIGAPYLALKSMSDLTG